MESLRDALFALHSGDGSLQKQSNSWLTGFVESQDAWSICLDLYNQMDGNSMVQFSCLSMLLSKVRSEWASLDEGVRVDLRKQFRYVSDAGVLSIYVTVLRLNQIEMY
jgi:hypothetical protein